MPPAKPAKKKLKQKGVPLKSALCHTCGARIKIPDGWTIGPAVRRHYWAKHRTVMQPGSKSGR